MSKLADEFRRLRLAAGYDSMSAFARALGVTPSYVSLIENGKRSELSRENWVNAAKLMNVPLSHFAEWYAPGVDVVPPPNPPGDRPAAVVIPLGDFIPTRAPILVGGTVGAGPGRHDGEPGERVSLQGEFPGATCTYRVVGDSMSDEGIFDGDLVVAKPAEKCEPQTGDLVIVYMADADEHVLKAISISPGERSLSSRNKKSGPKPPRVTLTRADDVRGVVIGVMGRRGRRGTKK